MNMISCYENLANAVVIQAVEDYRNSLKILAYQPGHYEAALEKKKIERFFQSDEFRGLTSVDGEMLLRRLRMEVAGER
jgi:hypothetical protein